MADENYDGPERRADHDLIIGMARDLKNLCRKYDTNRADIKAELTSIHNRIDEQTKSCVGRVTECNKLFVPSKVFYTALSIILLVIGTLGTVAYETRTDFVRHKSVATEVRGHLEGRLDKMEDVYTSGFYMINHSPTSDDDDSHNEEP